MSANVKLFKSGLVFLTKQDADIVDFGSRAAEALETIGARVNGFQVIDVNKASIDSDGMKLRLEIQNAETQIRPSRSFGASAPQMPEGAKQVLVIKLIPQGDYIAERCEACLATIALKLTCEFKADFVQWLSPDAMISGAAFAKANSKVVPILDGTAQQAPAASTANEKPQAVRPRAVRSAMRPAVATANALPPVEEAEAQVAYAFEVSPEELAAQKIDLRDVFVDEVFAKEGTIIEGKALPDPIARLATWMLSVTVALFSLPIAIFLVIYNLAKGEDFRVSAHGMALAGLFLAQSEMGAAVTFLSGII